MEPKSEGAGLEDAIQLAVEAHRGQHDKAGQPYILHLLRVMLRQEEEHERIVAVLHDLVEDTSYTLEDLRTRRFPDDVIEAIDVLTKQDDHDYDKYLTRVLANPIARKVKLGDLEDNLDLRRLVRHDDPRLSADDVRRLEKYLAAWRRVKGLEVRGC